MKLWAWSLMLVSLYSRLFRHAGLGFSSVLTCLVRGIPDFSAMGTATKYRNQGAASMLMETFVAEVDRRGLRAYVEGTAAALGVYKKYGFEEVDHLKLDLKPWKTGEYFNVCMFRPAQQNATGSR